MSLEIKKKELEKMKVTASMMDMEIKICELDEQKKRLYDNIEIQKARISELELEIKTLKGA